MLENNEWTPTTEFIPNSVFSTHTTTQAIAIANGDTRRHFDLRHIARHKGGLFAANKLQSYGCNYLYEEFLPDFLITSGVDRVKAVAESGICIDHIVYTNAQYLLEYPGQFYLVPQNPALDAGALAAYMAAFDGHAKVFLLGYDNYTDETQDTFWVKALSTIVTTYNTTEFVRIMPTAHYSCAVELIKQPNFRQISIDEFVREADIG